MVQKERLCEAASDAPRQVRREMLNKLQRVVGDINEELGACNFSIRAPAC